MTEKILKDVTLTPEELDLYNEYLAYRDVFLDFYDTFKKNHTRMSSLIARANLRVARKKGVALGKRRNLKRVEEISNLFDKGLSIKEIMKVLSLSRYCVTDNLKYAGKLRRGWEMTQFFYARVSKDDGSQDVDNQRIAFEDLGFTVINFVYDKCSGGIHPLNRPAFKDLIDEKIEKGDELHVLKLDRLSRKSIDAQKILEDLIHAGIKVHIHNLPIVDLSSAMGKAFFQMMATFAELERGLISERTKEGLRKANLNGRFAGRPSRKRFIGQVKELKLKGYSHSQIAKKIGMSRQTVIKIAQDIDDLGGLYE